MDHPTITYDIILYYHYFACDDTQTLWAAQKTVCQRLGLTGRIIVANEGINGTVEGPPDAIDAYITELHQLPGGANIDIKRSSGTGAAFPKLSIKQRDQLVSLNDNDPTLGPIGGYTAPHLDAEELYKRYEDGKEFYIVDMRNDYETEVGHFLNAICPDGFHHFRNLPDVLPQLMHLKDKTVVTVCTGGIRCEKASGFLLRHGFRDVYQLHNGIVTFMEKFPNTYFRGKLYVFDKRYTMGFNIDSPKHVSIGRCRLCSTPTESYANRYEQNTRKHGLLCDSCCSKPEIRAERNQPTSHECGCA